MLTPQVEEPEIEGAAPDDARFVAELARLLPPATPAEAQGSPEWKHPKVAKRAKRLCELTELLNSSLTLACSPAVSKETRQAVLLSALGFARQLQTTAPLLAAFAVSVAKNEPKQGH